MWFCKNKLQVNAAKTKSLLFHSSRKYQNDNALLINLNGQEIEQVMGFKYLGLYVDPLLNFDSHIDALTKTVRQRTRLLWKMRSFINTDLAQDSYVSLIEPVFIYCCHLYDGTSKANKKTPSSPTE